MIDMSLLQEIYTSFGPDVTDKDIAAALWHYSRDELEQLFELAETDGAEATSRFLAAREVADDEFGPGWDVEVTDPRRWPDHRGREADFEQLGLRYGEADGLKFWLLPADAIEVADSIAAPPLVVEDDDEAEWLRANLLHGGHVDVGDDWDTREVWPNLANRLIARLILLRYRALGSSAKVADWERSRLVCCCRR
jgi:hypothetical protein